ncbi:MAG TPA: hypothetical protein VIX38_04700 [Nitrososphaeraceae archaeon]
MTMIENKTNRIEFVRVNPNSGGPWDVWRIDYDEMEASYYQIVLQNGDVIPYDGWIGHYLEEKGFKVTEIDGVSYRFTKSREK